MSLLPQGFRKIPAKPGALHAGICLEAKGEKVSVRPP